MGIVFTGLGLLVLLCGALRAGFGNRKPAIAVAQAQPALEAPVADRPALLAAVCAAVAEAEGTDVSGFRVVSFKRRGGA